MAPHILLAPLDSSISSRSKVFVKYLDISAAGAAGIYSGIKPYTDVVRHLYNGYLVPPDKISDRSVWYEAMRHLYEDNEVRLRMIKNAVRDVAEKYETEIVYDEFLGLMRSLAQPGIIQPDLLSRAS
jgi:hypothetical protein